MSSSSLERLARTAYEAHRRAHPTPLPPWEDTTEQEQRAWLAAVSAIAAQTGSTVAEASPTREIVIQVEGERHSFTTTFTVGRQGNIAISDEFASSHHARFQVAHGRWFIEDLGSTNGTWLNGRRFRAPQHLKRGDKVKIGRTVMTVVSA